MANTFNNTFNSGGGKQTTVQGDHAIGEQNYNNAPQGVPPAEELLKLLAEIKARLPELPDKAQAKLRNAVEGAELEAQEDKPDREEIAAKLTAAQKILAAIPGTVAAALPVGELLGKALIWCGKVAGM
ncbi:hypothetical protein VU08_04060 [Desulfobulbus sp. F5]|nr:hypothetical protein [Desulfobulbus sp. F5]